MHAAFMSLQPHESGIHAVGPGAGEGSVTKVRFLVRAAAGSTLGGMAAGGMAVPVFRAVWPAETG